ncbi:MAG: hypothetical protein QMD17_02920 [Rhodocyclaceae bacterium]|nr:hypothetical protein [Rhodocyclaceae bacterium]
MNSFHARNARPKPKSVARAATHAETHGGVRADVLLVQRGLAASRAEAQRLIKGELASWKVGAGAMKYPAWGTAPIQKPAQLLPPDAVLYILSDDA